MGLYEDGLAKDAQVNLPAGLALDPDGSMYIADYGNRRIRRIGPDGVIKTFAVC